MDIDDDVSVQVAQARAIREAVAERVERNTLGSQKLAIGGIISGRKKRSRVFNFEARMRYRSR